MVNEVSKIQVLGNRFLFLPFGIPDEPPPGCKVYVPRHLRPPQSEGIIIQLGTPHRGKPTKHHKLRERRPGLLITEASDPGGHKLRRHACFLLAELKVGDRVRVDNEFGHFAVDVAGRPCQIRSVLDIQFVYQREPEPTKAQKRKVAHLLSKAT